MHIPLLAALLLLPLLVTNSHANTSLPREVSVNGIEFVHVPAGEFWYGIPKGRLSPLNHNDEGLRDVRIWQEGFYIAKYETRAKDFMRFVAAQAELEPVNAEYIEGADKGCSVQRDEAGNYFELMPEQDLPITHLSWNLANQMAAWLGFRLPTESEWTKAARGTDKRMWPWGSEYPDDTFAGYASGSPCHPTPVTDYPNGASPYGAFGMGGGVYEYVADWHNPHYYNSLKDGDRNPLSTKPLNASSDITGKINPLKVLRGGRWATAAEGTNIYARNVTEPDEPFRCYGARFAIDEQQVARLLSTGQALVLDQRPQKIND